MMKESKEKEKDEEEDAEKEKKTTAAPAPEKGEWKSVGRGWRAGRNASVKYPPCSSTPTLLNQLRAPRGNRPRPVFPIFRAQRLPARI